ncbi:unnamed protein product [Gulo gulo]|uniref:Uncharacterized protein n=1 Tax=Gulo gulo TaxID=48420 RepID=A0A9X9LD54_GULGU|nr:unnamed protein product [Gulo gulo]
MGATWAQPRVPLRRGPKPARECSKRWVHTWPRSPPNTYQTSLSSDPQGAHLSTSS